MTTYTDTHHTLTEDDFFARFKPVANHIDPNRGFDGCMFESRCCSSNKPPARSRRQGFCVRYCDSYFWGVLT
jgi:hypothetical protein